MTVIDLPALDGRSPLAFLASIGVLRLLRVHSGVDATLGFSVRTCMAQLGGVESIDAVVSAIQNVVDTIPADGVLPGVASDFPPRGGAPDGMRMTREELRDSISAEHLEHREWLGALVTDLSLDDKRRVDLSPFCAPTGQQTTRTMFEKPLEWVRRHPEVLREALESWQRYPDVTGEGLDHRVLFDAADAGNGQSSMRGVPGATWLALMALPWLRTTAISGEPLSLTWQRSRGPGPRRLMAYPLWEDLLDPAALLALLSHPLWEASQLVDGKLPKGADQLSVFMLCTAGRVQPAGSKSAGYLRPRSLFR